MPVSWRVGLHAQTVIIVGLLLSLFACGSTRPRIETPNKWIAGAAPAEQVASLGLAQYQRVNAYRAVYRLTGSTKESGLVTVSHRKPYHYRVEVEGCVIILNHSHFIVPHPKDKGVGCTQKTPYLRFALAHLLAISSNLTSTLASVEDLYAKRDGVKRTKLVPSFRLDLGPGVLRIGVGMVSKPNVLWTERLRQAKAPLLSETPTKVMARFDGNELVIDKATGVVHSWMERDADGGIKRKFERKTFKQVQKLNDKLFSASNVTVLDQDWSLRDRRKMLLGFGSLVMGSTLKRGLLAWNELKQSERGQGVKLLLEYFEQLLDIEYSVQIVGLLTKVLTDAKCQTIRDHINSDAIQREIEKRLPNATDSQRNEALQKVLVDQLSSEIEKDLQPILVQALISKYASRVKEVAKAAAVPYTITTQWLAHHTPPLREIIIAWSHKQIGTSVPKALAKCISQ